MARREIEPGQTVEGESGAVYQQSEVKDENLGTTTHIEPNDGYNNGLEGE